MTAEKFIEKHLSKIDANIVFFNSTNEIPKDFGSGLVIMEVPNNRVFVGFSTNVRNYARVKESSKINKTCGRVCIIRNLDYGFNFEEFLNNTMCKCIVDPSRCTQVYDFNKLSDITETFSNFEWFSKDGIKTAYYSYLDHLALKYDMYED